MLNGPKSNFDLRDKGLSTALGLEDVPRHRWYYVKEGFSPRLVEHAIQNEGLKSGELLLDPFSGSGTAPLTAAVAGLKTMSFEVNPFLHFLSNTKLAQADTKQLKASSDKLVAGLRRPTVSPLEGLSTFTYRKRWGRWLFSRSVLRAYQGGLQSLRSLPYRVRSILKLILIGSALDCCNASRDGKCLRYKANWRDSPYTTDDLIKAFAARLAAVIEDLDKVPLKGIDAKVLKGDARTLSEHYLAERFRLCVTSPPYLNSFDYSDVYRPELFLGGFVSSNEALMRIRLKTVRSHVQARWKDPVKENFGILYKECIEMILDRKAELWDKRIPLMIQGYFEDMQTILSQLRRRAKPNAGMWLVVSTSAYAGVEIPVDLILAEIGQQCGWYLREIGVLRYLRSSGQQMSGLASGERISVPLRESVVILNASRRAANSGSLYLNKN